jgi:hypothetical protein
MIIKMKLLRKYSLFLILSLQSNLFAQSNIELNGYLQNMQTVWAPKASQIWLFSNSFSNRFNFTWYAKDNLTFKTSIRNIFDYGQFVSRITGYSELASQDYGYFDLTEKISSSNSYVLYTNIDRLNFSYTIDDLEIQIGRQRINWGISSVWTPNDIFNSSSFINFDYAEKSGSDAIRLLYYLDFASSFELVSKIDHNNDLTLAGKLKFNKWDYDFQFLGGFSEKDIILGAGWIGDIMDAGFSGELSYFRDKENFSDTSGIIVSSLGANYTFSNSVFISAEFLYNSNGKTGKTNLPNNLFNLDYSAKNLSPARYSIFGQISYPITPLISSSLATIVNPSDGSLFLSPNTEISLNEDVYLLVAGQFFIGEDYTEWGDFGQFYYLRIKWNF